MLEIASTRRHIHASGVLVQSILWVALFLIHDLPIPVGWGCGSEKLVMVVTVRGFPVRDGWLYTIRTCY